MHCSGDDGRLGQGVLGLYEDGKGNLWAGVPNGLWRWKPGAPKFYSLTGEPDGIQGICEDADGTLLIGWKSGIYRFVDGKTDAYPRRRGSPQFPAKEIFRDRDGGLWIGTSGRGLVHVHQGRTDVLLPTDGLSGESVRTLFEDREGNIWVATNAGLDRFHDFAASTFAVSQGLSSATVGSVLASRDGNVWLATYGGLNHWRQGQFAIPSTGSSTGTINGQKPGSLFQDDRGRIWVSTFRGFGYLQNGQFTSMSGVPGGNVLSIAQNVAGNLWVDNEQVGSFVCRRQTKSNKFLLQNWAIRTMPASWLLIVGKAVCGLVFLEEVSPIFLAARSVRRTPLPTGSARDASVTFTSMTREYFGSPRRGP